MRLRVLVGAVLITVLPAGAAQSAPGTEQARKKVYELVAFSATSDVRSTPNPDYEGESHLRARLAPGKKYTGGLRVGVGTVWYKLNAAVDTRVRSRSYSCAESFQRENYLAGLKLTPVLRGGRQSVLVFLGGLYVHPLLAGTTGECRKAFSGAIKNRYYPLSLFKRKTFTLTASGEELVDGEGANVIVRYKTTFVLKRIR